MSSVTPSTAFTVCPARPKSDPRPEGKWTLRSRIEINGWRSVSISLRLSTRHKSRLRNDKGSDAPALAPRTGEPQFDKFLQRVHSAARTDTPAVSAPDPEAAPESDRGFPAPPKDPARNARAPAYTDCPAARKARRSAPAQTPCRRTSR